MHRKKSKLRRLKKVALGAIPFLVVVAIWTAFSLTKHDVQWLFPTPWETAWSYWELIRSGTIFGYIGVSAMNLLPPFILAAISALALGVAIGVNRNVRKIFYPFLSAMYPIPSLAWLPFVILLFGFTRPAMWIVIFISSFMKLIYTVISGVENINLNYILAARNMEFSQWKIITQVIVPSATPQIITGLRIGFGSAWRSLIGAEMLVVTLGGLGKFIWMSQWYYQYDNVIAGIITISLISVIIETIVFARIERLTLVKWGFVREN